MALTIRSLLGSGRLVTVFPSEGLHVAVERMLEHDYTQLPVVDPDGRLVGMVTSDSILRAMEAFGLKPAQMTVADAMFKPRRFDVDADVSELLNALRDQYAALVVDGEQKLVAIITGFDASEYFRGRAEDLMLVEDIESSVKDHVRAAFRDAAGKIQEAKLAAAIQRADPARSMRGRAERAIRAYIERVSVTADENALQSALDQCISTQQQRFDDLTLAQYVDLLLHASVWPAYAEVFGVDDHALRRLLDNVREIRNDLAHFKRDISSTERATLRYSAAWLERHPPRAPAFPVLPAHDYVKSIDTSGVNPVDEVGPGEGRYAKLAVWLEKLGSDVDLMPIAFQDIEQIMDAPLPPAARQHRSWWANDSVSHTQSQRWLEVGWRVSSVNLSEESVTFARAEEREKSYISFFSKLIASLERERSFTLRTPSPGGVSWHILTRLPDVRAQLGWLICAFARGGRIRVELYIDTADKLLNKAVFDFLHSQRDQIERAFGEPLSWERLEKRRASRIAIYRAGSIGDSPNELEALLVWATKQLIKLRNAVSEPVTKAFETVVRQPTASAEASPESL